MEYRNDATYGITARCYRAGYGKLPSSISCEYKVYTIISLIKLKVHNTPSLSAQYPTCVFLRIFQVAQKTIYFSNSCRKRCAT